jgi:hypothetical protein
MIKYQIEGCNATFVSKIENFDRDVMRWKQRHSLRYSATVTILENDEPTFEPPADSTINSNDSEQPTVSEDTATPKRTNKRKPKSEATDVPPMFDRLGKFDLSNSDEPTANLNDSTPESN